MTYDATVSFDYPGMLYGVTIVRIIGWIVIRRKNQIGFATGGYITKNIGRQACLYSPLWLHLQQVLQEIETSPLSHLKFALTTLSQNLILTKDDCVALYGADVAS